MTKITGIKARQVLDSRGNPTLEAEVWLADGSCGRAMVPSGASTGTYEALELRDGEAAYGGKAVTKAVRNVNEAIAPPLVGMDSVRQQDIDSFMIELDGTPNRKNLGANAIVAVSMAVARAAAKAKGLSLYRYMGGISAACLPVPFMNVLNGGRHADNSLDIQEYMVVPAGAKGFAEALEMGAGVYHALKSVLKSKGYAVAVGDEGGFAPALRSNEEALGLIVQAIKKAGYEPGRHCYLALDCAASEFQKGDKYVLEREGWEGDAAALVEKYEAWVKSYPIISIEDGLGEDDWEGWVHLTKALGGKVQIIGDDLFVTQKARFEKGITLSAANSILIKLNQVGTVSETFETIQTARQFGYRWVVSHRSGETEDTFIADLAVSAGGGQIKTGAPCRSERTAKYNRLLRIEEELGSAAVYGGAIVAPGRL